MLNQSKQKIFHYFNDKERLIDAYNAITGKKYPLNAELEYKTLENVLFQSQKNDIAFMIEGQFVVLIEHQFLSEISDKTCYPTKNNIRVGTEKQAKMAA
jgi:hypothetical protein